MLSGVASKTARAVAAVRAGTERLPAPYGDADADERLQRLVAAQLPVSDSPMSHYLRVRTRFFDRAVVAAIDAHVEQVIVAAAGYDGRALRYAKPGVAWFELDHPATQADKRARLSDLHLDTSSTRFVSADFATDDVAGRLAQAGCDSRRRSLVLAGPRGSPSISTSPSSPSCCATFAPAWPTAVSW